MPSVRIGQTEIAYELRRTATASERRITVTPGCVEVLALVTDDDAAIEGFLDRKRQWLFDTVRQVQEIAGTRPIVPRFMTGSKIPYRGRMSSLTVRRHDGPRVEIAHKGGFIVDLPAYVTPDAADAIVALEIKFWLKQRVRRDVHDIATAYEKRFGLKPRAIRVAEFVTGWGSCGPSGTIHIDWRLVFAPKRVLEYVVVHELAHLKYRSHSEVFWEFVKSMLRDFSKPKSWLEVNQGSLSSEFLMK